MQLWNGLMIFFALITIAFLINPNNSFVIASDEEVYIFEVPSIVIEIYHWNLPSGYNDYESILNGNLRFVCSLCHQYHFKFTYIAFHSISWSLNPIRLCTIHDSWSLSHNQGFILGRFTKVFCHTPQFAMFFT